jgi:hypothetical protein
MNKLLHRSPKMLVLLRTQTQFVSNKFYTLTKHSLLVSTEFTFTEPRTRAWSVPLVSSMKEKPDMHHHNLAVHYTSLIYGIGWALTAVNLRHPDPDDQCHYLYTGFEGVGPKSSVSNHKKSSRFNTLSLCRKSEQIVPVRKCMPSLRKKDGRACKM